MKRLWLVCGVVAAIGCGHGGSGDGKGGNTGTAGSGSGSAGTTGSGGSGQCATGSEGCACYGNDTCTSGLQCFSHLCVAITGTGGSATGTGGSTAGTAGSVGAGGSTSGAAGNTGAGGSTSGSAGNTGAGGSSQCPTGSEGCACYGNDTCNGSLKCLSHLCVSLGGTGGSATGTAGTTGTGGSAGSGGSGTGTAGTNGNTLTFTAGVIQAGSNSFGIAGGIYTFGDGVGSMITPNCTSDACFGNLNGTGPVCVSGIGTRVLLNAAGTDYDYATYWGAAMGMDLNNPTYASMAQQAYVASSHGVKGFQFTFQNTAGSVVRMTFKVRDPSSGSLVDYCLDLGTTTSIIHFSDAKQQCYATVPGPSLSAAMADHTEGLQWMVPTSTAASVPFNFCISNLTPLTQ